MKKVDGMTPAQRQAFMQATPLGREILRLEAGKPVATYKDRNLAVKQYHERESALAHNHLLRTRGRK